MYTFKLFALVTSLPRMTCFYYSTIRAVKHRDYVFVEFLVANLGGTSDYMTFSKVLLCSTKRPDGTLGFPSSGVRLA